MRRSAGLFLRFFSLLLSLLLAGGIPGPAPAAALTYQQYLNSQEFEWSAGRWQTWVLSSGRQITLPPAPQYYSSENRAELAELKAFQSQRTEATNAAVRYWASGPATMRWTEQQLSLIIKYKPNPPRASRGLALVHIAMYDAMVAAWNAKYAYPRVRPDMIDPSIVPVVPVKREFVYPSEHAVMAGAASRVLAYLFPQEAANLAALEQQAAMSRLWGGLNYRSDVEKGLQLGHAVADLVIARANGDSSNAVWDGSGRLTGLGYWEPTAPGFVNPPLEPVWGQVKPWLLERNDQFLPPPPPGYGTPEFTKQMQEVYTVSQNLTDEQKQIALRWAGGPGTETPPGQWNVILLELLRRDGFNTPRAARAMALLNAAQADAFISCWNTKYKYWFVRPITAIRQMIDPAWNSLITTPPFPAYTSGHSTTSGAAGEVLSYIFPSDAERLRAQAREAMNSRLYGGIHCSADNMLGLEMGQKIGLLAVRRGQNDGSSLITAYTSQTFQ